MADTRFCWPPSVILTPGKMREEGGMGGKQRLGKREITQQFNLLHSFPAESFTREAAKTSSELP